jgi:hypothetical protein
MILIIERVCNSMQLSMRLEKLIIAQLVLEIFRIMWKLNVHHRTLISASFIPIGGDVNVACVLTSSLFTASFKTILLSSPKSCNKFICSGGVY